jgi:hypothetical protein
MSTCRCLLVADRWLASTTAVWVNGFDNRPAGWSPSAMAGAGHDLDRRRSAPGGRDSRSRGWPGIFRLFADLKCRIPTRRRAQSSCLSNRGHDQHLQQCVLVGALCMTSAGCRLSCMMTNDSRLDIRLPHQQRAELVQLARDTGLTLPSLVRLATARLLNDREGLLRGQHGRHEAAA